MSTMLSRAALAAVLAVFAFPALAEGIEVHEAHAIQAMPGGPTAAAFMVIHNHGGPPDRLVDVRSDIAARTELHAHVADGDGVMRMIRVEGGFDLPTDGEIVLGRGGDHVMFLGVTEPLAEGEVFPLTLVFEAAGDVTVDVVVAAAAAGGAGGGGEMEAGALHAGEAGHGGSGHHGTGHEGMDHGAGSD